MNKTEKQKIKNIIKYNTSRQYFGYWVPAEIYEKWNDARKNPESFLTVHTGQISLDDICDALWNEMSYNPVRFGTKSPFVFKGIKDIIIFVNKYSEERYKTQNMVFFNIANLLKNKIYDLANLDPMVSAVGHTQKSDFPLNNPDTYEITQMYYILSNLAQSIHEIAKQNLADFNSSKKHRDAIIRVVKERHPNLIRPIKNVNYAEMTKQKQFLECLRIALNRKAREFEPIVSNINDLQELEFPGDTSNLETSLHKKQQEYNALEKKYIQQEQKYDTLLSDWKRKHNVR